MIGSIPDEGAGRLTSAVRHPSSVAPAGNWGGTGRRRRL